MARLQRLALNKLKCKHFLCSATSHLCRHSSRWQDSMEAWEREKINNVTWAVRGESQLSNECLTSSARFQNFIFHIWLMFWLEKLHLINYETTANLALCWQPSTYLQVEGGDKQAARWTEHLCDITKGWFSVFKAQTFWKMQKLWSMVVSNSWGAHWQDRKIFLENKFNKALNFWCQ